MKVLQINCVYGTGSTGRIVESLHLYYQKKKIISKVIYGRGNKPTNLDIYKCASEFSSKGRNLISRFNGNLYGMGNIETKRIIKYINKFNPDIVHLHCINGYFCNIYKLIEYLRDEKIKTVVTLHAEFLYTGNCGYAFECEEWKIGCQKCPNVRIAIGARNVKAPSQNWEKMYKAFAGFNDNLIVAGVSGWISERATQSKILRGKKITTVFNGLDTNIFNSLYSEPKAIRNIKKDGKKIILHVTPYFEDDNKGGRWVLNLAAALERENVHFIVIGKTEKEYKINNISFLGEIKDPKMLASFYAKSDITLLTSKRETFSMICAESLCCGTPVIGFRAGAPERIALKEYSDFVQYGDLNSLKEKIMAWLKKPIQCLEISEEAMKVYSKKRMGENYIKIYKQMLESENE